MTKLPRLIRYPSYTIPMVSWLTWSWLFDKSYCPAYQQLNPTGAFFCVDKARGIMWTSYILMCNRNRLFHCASSERVKVAAAWWGVQGQVGQVFSLPHKIMPLLPNPNRFHFPGFSVSHDIPPLLKQDHVCQAHINFKVIWMKWDVQPKCWKLLLYLLFIKLPTFSRE